MRGTLAEYEFLCKENARGVEPFSWCRTARGDDAMILLGWIFATLLLGVVLEGIFTQGKKR
jgi:hypothetical protein